MIGDRSRAYVLASVAAACLVAAPAYSQANPFMPVSAASKAEMERMEKRILKAVEDRLAKAGGNTAPPAGGPAVPGVPGAPGAPVPGAGANGAAVPGGMTPPGVVPGVPGAPTGAPLEMPKTGIEAATEAGVRFIGCINGAPKFVQKNGLRVVFTAKEIRDAQRAGLVPECR